MDHIHLYPRSGNSNSSGVNSVHSNYKVGQSTNFSSAHDDSKKKDDSKKPCKKCEIRQKEDLLKMKEQEDDEEGSLCK